MSKSCYRALTLMLAVFLITGTAGAAIESKQFENSETEARYKKMIAELRCLVCQNQNLSDSDADLAKDLRNQVEKMLKSGNSDEQIADYMVTRYGDFILYNPPLKTSTLVLWAGPLLIVIIGIIIVANIFRRRDRQKSTISPQDLSRAKSLINDKTPH